MREKGGRGRGIWPAKTEWLFILVLRQPMPRLQGQLRPDAAEPLIIYSPCLAYE